MTTIAGMPETARARGKIAPAKLAHIVLRTQPERVGTILDWYKTVLEAEAMLETEGLGFITYDNEHHRIGVLGIPGTQTHVDGLAGLHHVAFTYGSLSDLVNTYERLRDLGITPEFTINHGPTTSMYYFDPDKNQVELQVDNMSVAQCAEYFQTDAYNENSVGVVFDPEELLARHKSGVPEEVLLIRPDGPPPAIADFPAN
jgi:catechol-2,3-dioxygenase